VSETAELLIGVIAVAVAVLAVVQVWAIVAGLRVARRVERLMIELETGVKPLLDNLNTLSAEASRVATAAAGNVERFDRLFGEMMLRFERTLDAAHRLVTGPARDGMAVVAGVRAAVTALQGMREASRRRSASRARPITDEEESLFIG
jgi:hypothetical protein